MPVRVSVPNGLKPYIALGLNPEYRDKDTQAFADCPWCGGENKFTIQIESSLARCFRCDARPSEEVYPNANGFNAISFAHTLWQQAQTPDAKYEELAHQRKLLYPQTLVDWGVKWNPNNHQWLVPAFDQNGKFHQLYRYLQIKKGDEWVWRLLPLPGLHGEGESHGIFGMQLWDNSKQTIWITEGPWDAMALYEVMQRVQLRADMLYLTDYANDSLYNSVNICAIPGANVFKDEWTEPLSSKDVILPFDSDYPRSNPTTRQLNPPAGWEGCRKVTETLLSLPENQRPQSVSVVQWGEKGFDPDKPDGYDVRDHLASGGDSIEDRVPQLASLLGKVDSPPLAWKESAKKASKKELQPKQCESWEDLKNAWQIAFKWSDGLDNALSGTLATAMSTNHIGDQIWLMLLGPPSTGKTSLIMGLAVSRKYTLYCDTFTKLFSGYQVDAEGKQDTSLMPKAKGKSFIIKDGDTLRTLPNRNAILAQLRTIYDRAIHVVFGNKMSRDHTNFSTTMIVCGTAAMRDLDRAELGGRFLTISLMDVIDPRHERMVSSRAANQIRSNLGMMLNGKPESSDTPEMIEAKQMTGGYLEYLRRNSDKLLPRIHFSDEALEVCLDCAEFTAHMRARPSAIQNEITEREMTPRLSKQLTLFAACTAVVMGRKSVDSVVLDRVRKVARDSSRGVSLDIAKVLYEKDKQGREPAALAIALSKPVHEVTNTLFFLRRVGAIERFEVVGPKGGRPTPRYRLTYRMKTLYKNIMETYIPSREVPR